MSSRLALLLFSAIAMTQQPVSAAQPWPTSIDSTTDTHSFFVWEGAAPGALGANADTTVPAEIHVFEPGVHGVGLAAGDPALGEWPLLLRNWLRGRGLLGN